MGHISTFPAISPLLTELSDTTVNCRLVVAQRKHWDLSVLFFFLHATAFFTCYSIIFFRSILLLIFKMGKNNSLTGKRREKEATEEKRNWANWGRFVFSNPYCICYAGQFSFKGIKCYCLKQLISLFPLNYTDRLSHCSLLQQWLYLTYSAYILLKSWEA